VKSAGGRIVALYVMWSRMGREPKPVWGVMLGRVSAKRPPPGIPRDTQDQYTFIVDVERGEWITGTNTRERGRSSNMGR